MKNVLIVLALFGSVTASAAETFVENLGGLRANLGYGGVATHVSAYDPGLQQDIAGNWSQPIYRLSVEGEAFFERTGLGGWMGGEGALVVGWTGGSAADPNTSPAYQSSGANGGLTLLARAGLPFTVIATDRLVLACGIATEWGTEGRRPFMGGRIDLLVAPKLYVRITDEVRVRLGFDHTVASLLANRGAESVGVQLIAFGFDVGASLRWASKESTTPSAAGPFTQKKSLTEFGLEVGKSF